MMASKLSVIPSAAIFDERLGLADLRILCALASFADRSGKCWPATTTLAQKLRVSVRRVRTCLRTLEACGYVQTTPRPGHRSVYLIIREPSDPGTSASGVGDDPGTSASGPPEPEHPGTPEPEHPPNRVNNRVNNNYAFSGRLIRLNEEGFDAWATAYHRLDLRAELQALDDYYDRELTGKERKNWYQRCSGALAKKHREARQESNSVHGTPDSDVIY